MRLLIPLALGAALALLLVPFLRGRDAQAVSGTLAGERTAVVADVVEVRDASVFAGACHLAGEWGSQGREALVGVAVREGRFGGVDLDGVQAVLALSSTDNLATGAPRTAELWVGGDQRQAGAVAGWMSDARPDLFDRLVGVHTAHVTVERSCGGFEVSVPGLVAVSGEPRTDGKCCTMKERRLYEPVFADPGASVVGLATTCEFEGSEALLAWQHADANNAFVGELRTAGEPDPCVAPGCEPRGCGERPKLPQP